MVLPAELANLPPPVIINELSYETTLADFVAKLVVEMAEQGIVYDVGMLETDPAKILLEVYTYADTLLRARINEAIRANLLAFATGGDLDHLAQFYDVTRLFGETDDALRERVILAIRGRSPGGTEPRYQFIARSADVRVKDVAVYTVGRDPTVRVAIFSTDPGGVASTALVAKVNAALQDPAVRMVNDVIVVAAAVQTVVNVSARVWLLPTVNPEQTMAELPVKVRAAWEAVATLGRDLTQSWLIGAFMQAGGVQRVQLLLPAADSVAPFDRAIAIGTFTLTNEGIAF